MKKKEEMESVLEERNKESELESLQDHLLAVRTMLDEKFDVAAELKEQNKLVALLRQDKQNLEKAIKSKDEALQVAHQHILERNQEWLLNKKTIAELDAKIKSQLRSTASLKEDLLETSKKLKTYLLEVNPLKEKLIELQAENRDVKDLLEQREKDVRKLFLDLTLKEKEPKQEEASYQEKLEQLQEAHEQRLKEVVSQYTQENLLLGSQIGQLRKELARRDHILKEIAKIQADVANKLLNSPL